MHVKNIRLTIAYDGTNYLGWQNTKMGPSIESTLESTLSRILQEQVILQAASRTDAGVHANGQVVNFMMSKERPSLEQLHISLNCLLPKDIVVLDVSLANDSFHPTLECQSKEYHYSICFGSVQLPQLRLYSWHYPHHLDIDKMRHPAKELIGLHDFSAFCNFKKNANYDHYMRHVYAINIVEVDKDRIEVQITGNNFLYKMVRNIVGTLVYVGCGKISIDSVRDILRNKDRTQAGITAPAHGLSLYKINY